MRQSVQRVCQLATRFLPLRASRPPLEAALVSASEEGSGISVGSGLGDHVKLPLDILLVVVAHGDSQKLASWARTNRLLQNPAERALYHRLHPRFFRAWSENIRKNRLRTRRRLEVIDPNAPATAAEIVPICARAHYVRHITILQDCFPHASDILCAIGPEPFTSLESITLPVGSAMEPRVRKGGADIAALFANVPVWRLGIQQPSWRTRPFADGASSLAQWTPSCPREVHLACPSLYLLTSSLSTTLMDVLGDQPALERLIIVTANDESFLTKGLPTARCEEACGDYAAAVASLLSPVTVSRDSQADGIEGLVLPQLREINVQVPMQAWTRDKSGRFHNLRPPTDGLSWEKSRHSIHAHLRRLFESLHEGGNGGSRGTGLGNSVSVRLELVDNRALRCFSAWVSNSFDD